MRYNVQLANRVRNYFATLPLVEEKEMFNGLVFMVNDKMCVGVGKDYLMARLHPEEIDKVLQLDGCQQMKMKERVMKGYVFIDENVISQNKDLHFWLDLALSFNPLAKASPKRKKRNN